MVELQAKLQIAEPALDHYLTEAQSSPAVISRVPSLSSAPVRKLKKQPCENAEQPINQPAELAQFAFDEPANLTGIHDELAHLQQVCRLHISSLNQARSALVRIAFDIAEIISGSGLLTAVLPGRYQVITFQNELYLLKLTLDGEPSFVATGQDNMFTRMHLSTLSGLRPCDLAEFVEDLNQGLLREITAYVSCRLRAFDSFEEAEENPDAKTPSSQPEVKAQAVESSAQDNPITENARALRLSSIGRRANRMAIV